MIKHQKKDRRTNHIVIKIIRIAISIVIKSRRLKQIKDIKNRLLHGNFVKRKFINFVSDKISDPKIILDIGSRDAIQSIELSKIYPKTKIYAFECNPQCIKMCIRNIKKYKNIEIVPYAVFNKNEKMKFYPVQELIGASSLLKLDKEYSQKLKISQKEITVDAIRIDTWAKTKGIKKIDLVWIDLQGTEYEAFESMGELLSNVQAIYTEVEVKELYINQKLLKDVTKLLNENGLSLLKYTESSKDSWGNAIYINKQIIN